MQKEEEEVQNSTNSSLLTMGPRCRNGVRVFLLGLVACYAFVGRKHSPAQLYIAIPLAFTSMAHHVTPNTIVSYNDLIVCFW